MTNPSENTPFAPAEAGGSSGPILALVAAPGVLVLLALALFGRLDWLWALAGAAIVVAAALLLVLRQRRALAGLRRRIQGLGRGDETAEPALDPLLLPEIEKALAASADRQHRERADLETAVASNEAILATLPDPLIMLDGRRRIVRLNAAAETLFGVTAEGRDLTDVFREPTLLEAVDEILSGASSRVIEFDIPGPVQRNFSARTLRLPAKAADGTVAILTLHDLTSVKRAEQLRADFVANASHELRTPLSSLLGFIETLRGPARDDEEARGHFLSIMHDQALRMTRLVEDLLSLSRIEMKEHSAPTTETQLAQLLPTVVGGLEPQAREKNITIEIELDGLAPVIGDADDLAQVFQNLIDNAVKYGRNGTAVRVVAGDQMRARLRIGGPAVAVSVVDQGEGIAREHLPRLTERFYRVDKARSRKLGGTGLGLAIVKHIVNRHRGAIEVESVEGEGSSFTVMLPAAASARDEVAAE